MNITGIAHISIPVTNLVQSTIFYNVVLGMKILKRIIDSMVFLDCAGTCVILVKVPHSLAADKVHTAFIVPSDEFNTAQDELRNYGIPLRYENREKGTLVGTSAHFFDLDGNHLEIIDLKAYNKD